MSLNKGTIFIGFLSFISPKTDKKSPHKQENTES